MKCGHRFSDIVPAIDHAVAIDRVGQHRWAPAPSSDTCAPPRGCRPRALWARRSASCGFPVVPEVVVEDTGRAGSPHRPFRWKSPKGRIFRNRGHQVALVVDRQLGDICKAANGRPARYPWRPRQPPVERHLPSRAASSLRKTGRPEWQKSSSRLMPGIAGGKGIADRVVGEDLLVVEGLRNRSGRSWCSGEIGKRIGEDPAGP